MRRLVPLAIMVAILVGSASADARQTKTVPGIAKLGKVRVTVSAVTVVPPSDTIEMPSKRTVELTLTVNNRTGKRAEVPDTNLHCKGDKESYGWFAQSTVAPGQDIAPHGRVDGVMYLEYPEGCATPFVRFDALTLLPGLVPSVDFVLGI